MISWRTSCWCRRTAGMSSGRSFGPRPRGWWRPSLSLRLQPTYLCFYSSSFRFILRAGLMRLLLWIRIRMDPHRFLSAGSKTDPQEYRAEGFSFSLDVLHRRLGIKKLQLLIKKVFFSVVKFFHPWSSNPGSTFI
jgi:hypothetical protein